MAETPKHKSAVDTSTTAAAGAETKPATEPTKEPEPPKPIAVGDVINGWTVETIDGPTVLLALGPERRSRPLAELEQEREAGPATPIKVGDVIDGWTILSINSPTDVQAAQGLERRTLTLQDLERAKHAAHTLTTADLERVKVDAAKAGQAPAKK